MRLITQFFLLVLSAMFGLVLICSIGSPPSAQAMTTSSYQIRIEGEVFFPEIGRKIPANLVCFDSQNQVYQYLRKGHYAQICPSGWNHDDSDYREAKLTCPDARTVYVPPKVFLAGPTYQEKVCINDNLTSTRSNCTEHYYTVARQQPLTYTILTFEPSDLRQSRPVGIESRKIRDCL